jgi:hypothetical protein
LNVRFMFFLLFLLKLSIMRMVGMWTFRVSWLFFGIFRKFWGYFINLTLKVHNQLKIFKLLVIFNN